MKCGFHVFRKRLLGLLVWSIGSLVLMFGYPNTASAQYFGRNKVQYDAFDFKKFDTDHFSIYLYPEIEPAVQDAARMAERWYHRHRQIFGRELDQRNPIIFYANDADFQQTNVVGGQIGEGTGGVTESLKQRVVMPLTGIYKENDHVLGHELVHAFQYDIAFSRAGEGGRFRIDQIPLWYVEGMAEYLSTGRNDSHTAMWLRDAALRDDLPTIDQLTRRPDRYFPYRFGQAYLAYIGGKYGDGTIVRLFQQAGLGGLDSAFVYTLGITPDSLSAEWKEIVKESYLPLTEGRAPRDSVGRRLIAKDLNAGDLNLAPALSPDGRYLAFLSEKDLFSIDLYIADVETGRIVKRYRKATSDAHIDALRFISASGTWSPDGKKFAFIIFSKGDNAIAVWDLESGEIERTISIDGVSAMMNLAWSPDGRSLALSGLDGGISDLFILDLNTNKVRQLTDDRYADLQPAWSPDGRTLAFMTDRGPGGTDFDRISFAPMRIGLYDLDTDSIQILTPAGDTDYINPQFSPDGQALYFVADVGGFKDIYRYDLREDYTYQVTRVQTGVSGITRYSPALSVATQNGRVAFSVFSNNTYAIHTLESDEAIGTEVEMPAEGVSLASVLPPYRGAVEGMVEHSLHDPGYGLPEHPSYDVKPYSARMKLDYVAPPSLGVSVGGVYGMGVGGSVGMYFSDMLGNRNLSIGLMANGTYKDIGGQVMYLNQKRRFNFGGFASHIPYLYGSAFFDVYEDPESGAQYTRYNEVYQRIFVQRLGVVGSLPFSTVNRVETALSAVRYSFDYELHSFLLSGQRVDSDQIFQARDPLYLAQVSMAYVKDFSFFGFTSPLRGGRYRLQVTPSIGTDRFVMLLADYRRYFRLDPLTFAFRGLHIGNYGAKEDDMFGAEYLGEPYYLSFVRGYSYYSFESRECSTNNCSEIGRLRGTRVALASAEIRLPLLGSPSLGLVSFQYLPTDLSLFVDAGVAWSEEDPPVWKWSRHSSERIPVVSTGVSTRMNLFNALVLEIYYAYPFQRPEKGGHMGFLILPGW